MIMASGKHILGKGNSKRVFGTAKVGDRGQIVIPKEARDMFDLQPGSTILVLGDVKRGLAILPREAQSAFISQIFEETDHE